MSLRMRLVVALVGLVAVGLVVAGTVTYTSLRSFLMTRVDQQLTSAVGPMAEALKSSLKPADLPGGGLPPGSPPIHLPPGTYGEVRDSTGRTVDKVQFTYGDTSIAPPSIPKELPASEAGASQASIFTVGASGAASPRYRVLAQPMANNTGTLLLAVPLTEVSQTLGHLLMVELPLTFTVLLALALLTWWIVRRGLRPLEHMSATADAIAAGDLSRRVETVDPRTEVGRLGSALNVMLSRIEEAFAERRASEDRLRRFLADASHELRTPLTSIRGYAELFRRGADRRPEDLAASMRRIEQEATRMGVIVEDLLLLARLDQSRALRKEPLDLARVVDDAVKDARAADPTRVITFESPGPVTLSGDEDRLHQVASNLLSNALVHTPAGSPVKVELTVEGEEAVLSVADSGPGLSAEDLAKIFEPFYRLDGARGHGNGGAGLGLSIVSAVATAHGGSARAESTLGEGAVFLVRLPLAGPEED
jgi:two-component system, OmpR family, sensor kinase